MHGRFVQSCSAGFAQERASASAGAAILEWKCQSLPPISRARWLIENDQERFPPTRAGPPGRFSPSHRSLGSAGVLQRGVAQPLTLRASHQRRVARLGWLLLALISAPAVAHRSKTQLRNGGSGLGPGELGGLRRWGGRGRRRGRGRDERRGQRRLCNYLGGGACECECESSSSVVSRAVAQWLQVCVSPGPGLLSLSCPTTPQPLGKCGCKMRWMECDARCGFGPDNLQGPTTSRCMCW